MPQAWWDKGNVDPERLKPDVPKTLTLPPLTPKEVIDALWRFKQEGLPMAAIARTASLGLTVFQNAIFHGRVSDKTCRKISWIIRALDAKEIRFVKAKFTNNGLGKPRWECVRGDAPVASIDVQTRLGVCTCGRYELCPCGIIRTPRLSDRIPLRDRQAKSKSRKAGKRRRYAKRYRNAKAKLEMQQAEMQARIRLGAPGAALSEVQGQPGVVGSAPPELQRRRGPGRPKRQTDNGVAPAQQLPEPPARGADENESS
jgi:hypothetical protein